MPRQSSDSPSSPPFHRQTHHHRSGSGTGGLVAPPLNRHSSSRVGGGDAVGHRQPASQHERHIRVNPETNLRELYETDGRGRQTYMSYYNSAEDPSFQSAQRKGGGAVPVTSVKTQFSFVSSGGAPSQRRPTASRPSPPLSTTIIEEAADETSVREEDYEEAQAVPHRLSSAPQSYPIVEEPDEEELPSYSQRHAPGTTRRSPGLSHAPTHRDREVVLRQGGRSPYAHSSLMADPLFAVHQQMAADMTQLFGMPMGPWGGRSIPQSSRTRHSQVFDDPLLSAYPGGRLAAMMQQMQRDHAAIFGGDLFPF